MGKSDERVEPSAEARSGSLTAATNWAFTKALYGGRPMMIAVKSTAAIRLVSLPLIGNS